MKQHYSQETLHELKNQLTLCQQLIQIRNLQMDSLKEEEPDFEKLETYQENEKQIIHRLQFSIDREKEWKSKIDKERTPGFESTEESKKELFQRLNGLSHQIIEAMTQHKNRYEGLLRKATKAVEMTGQQKNQGPLSDPQFVDITG